MDHHAVLIVAGDVFASALLGAAVEHAGCHPNFPRRGETARSALLRVRPRLVLLSCDHEDACTDAFVGPALMTGAALLLVQTRDLTTETRTMIERLDLDVVDLARDPGALARCISDLECR